MNTITYNKVPRSSLRGVCMPHSIADRYSVPVFHYFHNTSMHLREWRKMSVFNVNAIPKLREPSCAPRFGAFQDSTK